MEERALDFVKEQLTLDLTSKTPSLLAKWLPSENASAKSTRVMAGIVRTHLGITHKQYRKVLSTLRERINIVERLMSANEWDPATREVNSAQYQYSLRRARPEKVTYFLKQALIASKKLMWIHSFLLFAIR